MPIENVKCPKCDGPMKARESKHGKFWGCANYPHCTGTRNSLGESARNQWDQEYHEEHGTVMPSERQRDNDRRRWR